MVGLRIVGVFGCMNFNVLLLSEDIVLVCLGVLFVLFGFGGLTFKGVHVLGLILPVLWLGGFRVACFWLLCSPAWGVLEC